MIKRLTKFFLFLITIIILIIIYLSFFGINTNKFNDLIKSKVLNINPKIKLDLNSLDLKLNLSNLTINVTTDEPNLLFNNNKIALESIKTNVSIKSLIKKKFLISNLEISSKKNKLDDLILLARSFKNNPELFILSKVIKDGFLVADIKLNFDIKGNIKDDYEIKGFIKKAKIDILRKYYINDLNLIFKIEDKKYFVQDISANLNELELLLPNLTIEEKNNEFLVKGKVINNKNQINIKLLKNFVKDNLLTDNVEKIEINSENNFNFKINKKLKINDFNLESKINLNELVYKKNLSKINEYFPAFKNKIELINHKILIKYKKNNLSITGNGNILIDDKTDNLIYKIVKRKNKYFFETEANLNENSLIIKSLQYKKKENSNSTIKIKGIYKENGKIEFSKISLNENKNNFLIENLKLNSFLKIIDFNKLKLNYINNNNIKNNINLKKDDNNYQVYGQSFDFINLIDEILDNKNSSSLFENLNSSFIIEIDKGYLDKSTFVRNLKINMNFKKNKIDKLDLKSFFPDNKRLTLTIYTKPNNEKITTLFTDYPKPLIKRYEFVKGFEEGTLDFYSIKKNDVSNSTLIIDNFKVQEVPVLAKLLTLASLQGIADLLTGEGIRFTDFEMKFSNDKQLMKIEEIYAIGPAISILMKGYIQNKELISLKGTLVPATTINRTISSIPLIGKILVGKKTGEGVFGVSFKIKGPPEDLKTTVNPVKTLTPRFITRTLEKLKKD